MHEANIPELYNGSIATDIILIHWTPRAQVADFFLRRRRWIKASKNGRQSSS